MIVIMIIIIIIIMIIIYGICKTFFRNEKLQHFTNQREPFSSSLEFSAFIKHLYSLFLFFYIGAALFINVVKAVVVGVLFYFHFQSVFVITKARVPLIGGLPPTLTSFRIISS